MPAISKIRLTNVVYEDGNKRYNDEIFLFDGHNGAILLENGGGKTVFIHTVLQAVLPHTNLGDRKIKETLGLENAPAHIGIEWVKNDNPRRYVASCVSLFLTKDGLDSLRYVYEYDGDSNDLLEKMPFVRETGGKKRPADRGEMMDYYSSMKQKSIYAQTFPTITSYKEHLEEQHHIISDEWENVVKINRDEGGIDKFFESCRTTTDLYDRLLIPTVEDSIMGHDEGMFADLFEKQREGFHTYKKLKESIIENEQIQQELGNYVDVFYNFDAKQKAYEAAKSHAKGTWNVILDERHEIEVEEAGNLADLKTWGNNDVQHKIKQDSYQILLEEREASNDEQAYKRIQATYEASVEKLDANKKRLYSLRHANFRKELKEHEQLLAIYKDKIAEQTDSDKLIDYEEKLEEANQALHGCFIEEMEAITKLIKGMDVELRPLETEHEKLLSQREMQNKSLQEADIKEAGLAANIELNENQASKLKQELLANPEQETVKTEYNKWIKRHPFLDEEINRLKQRDKQIDKEVNRLEEEKSKLLDEKHQGERNLDHVKQEETRLQESHNAVLTALGELRPKWSSLTDLYLRENTVYDELIDMKKGLEKEQEDLLYEERIVSRFVDDYGDQHVFFGDRYMHRQLSLWKNQFDYVESGVEFFQAMAAGEEKVQEADSLWALTLVTTNKSKQGIIEKLEQVADKIQFPINVMTLEEAKQMGAGESPHNTWVTPAHWKRNLDNEQFASWRREIQGKADRATMRRKEKEAERSELKSIISQFEAFFLQYPAEKREELTDSIQTIQKKINEMNGLLTRNKDEQGKLKQEKAANHGNIEAHQSEMNGLEFKISKANDFFRVDEDLNKSKVLLGEVLKTKEKLKLEIQVLTKQISRYLEEIQDKKGRKVNLQTELGIIKANTDYQEVKAYTATFTGEEKAVLLKRRKELDYAIHNIRQSYQELVAKCDAEMTMIQRTKEAIRELENEFTRIDFEMEFPPDGKQLMETLREQIKEEEHKIRQIETEKIEAKEIMDKQASRVKTMVEQFNQRHRGERVYQFNESVEDIEALLKAEKIRLAEREAYLHQEQVRISKALQDIRNAESGLDNFEEAHHFKSTTVESRTFTENERSEFSYHRKKYVIKVTNELRMSKQAVDQGVAEVAQARRRFREFCRGTITDGKLRNMAIQGIEHKETYDEILTFQKNMVVRIDAANKYAREYISQNDKDMQAFINNVHHHLQNLTGELRVIPKKTKVKIGNDWKEIFKFTIPEWSEEDGKQRIREHIDWILTQLESSRYQDEHGVEDHGKVRKDIETWFQSKQLLQIVMSNEGMKVTCRKVTNDKQVSMRFYSWEQSNNWSGGEKWSKNMTLFLGILNYVAEKKQHIQANMKLHRTVILDNPFGKASSEHVLSPVFFIAEQLGFQIIALTAHAEGKFLQDYFPIIYSCRLRASADPTKKVMTKEKHLHHAYFQDHDPSSMDRLGEVEQMELF